jgi:hypothetical protein
MALAFAFALPLGPARAAGAARAQAAQLPEASPPVGPLRRGANGELIIVTPEEERKAGRPLCSEGSLCVGKGETYATLGAALAAAKTGDRIEVVSASYHEPVSVAVSHITILGVAGRPHLDCAGVAPADKGCIAILAEDVTLDNLEISGAEGACVRSDGGATLALNDIFCHGSGSGLVAGGGTIAISHSEFFDNAGTKDGGTIDLGRACVHVSVSGSIFRDTRDSDEFVSRCLKTDISDSTFRSRHGRRALDFPMAGDALVYRSSFEKTDGARDKEIIGFSEQSCEHVGILRLKEVQIDNARRDADLVNFDKCKGTAITLEGVVVSGAPVATEGFFTYLSGNNLGAATRSPGRRAPSAPAPAPAR